MNHALRRAQEQRLVALRNAFATIDAFAIPSLSPPELDKYEAVKASLLDNYGRIDEPQNLAAIFQPSFLEELNNVKEAFAVLNKTIQETVYRMGMVKAGTPEEKQPESETSKFSEADLKWQAMTIPEREQYLKDNAPGKDHPNGADGH